MSDKLKSSRSILPMVEVLLLKCCCFCCCEEEEGACGRILGLGLGHFPIEKKQLETLGIFWMSSWDSCRVGFYYPPSDFW